MCTDFRLFILTFNEIALTLARPPIILTVSSLDCLAGNKNAEYQLNANDVMASGVDSTADFLYEAKFPPFMIRVTRDDGFCTKPLLPKHLDAQFIVILRQLSHWRGVWAITLNTS